MNEFLRGILEGINSFVGNYGWSVILFTLLIRVLISPLDYKSRVGMRKTQQLQPKIAALQKKYAGDQEKLNRKMSELYKAEHVSPLSSCLPMLITLPILFAMFGAMRLVANEHLARQAFAILQGETPVMESWLWIKNIWVADSPFVSTWPALANLQTIEADTWLKVFNEVGANLPAALNLTAESFAKANLSATVSTIYAAMSEMPSYIQAISSMPGWTFNLILANVSLMQNFNGFFILPILSAATQYLMTLVTPTTPAPAAGDASAQQAQSMSGFMKWFFPLFSLYICANYNSVFAIYWVAANIFATIENFAINKYLDAKEKKLAPVETEGMIK